MAAIQGLLLDVERESIVSFSIEDELEEYYKYLKCSTIEMVRRKIGKKVFTIICDEEGTFKECPKISAIDDFGNPMLVGNLFICNEVFGEDDTYLSSLSPEEAEYILDRTEMLSTRMYPKAYPMITQCTYDY